MYHSRTRPICWEAMNFRIACEQEHSQQTKSHTQTAMLVLTAKPESCLDRLRSCHLRWRLKKSPRLYAHCECERKCNVFIVDARHCKCLRYQYVHSTCTMITVHTCTAIIAQDAVCAWYMHVLCMYYVDACGIMVIPVLLSQRLIEWASDRAKRTHHVSRSRTLSDTLTRALGIYFENKPNTSTASKTSLE